MQFRGSGAAMPEVPLPAGLQAELRPYQQQGLNWLQFLRTHGLAGILADDMGLAKPCKRWRTFWLKNRLGGWTGRPWCLHLSA